MKRAGIVILVLFLGTMVSAVERNMVVMEAGTATWCSFCPGVALAADEFVEFGANVAVIEYHSTDSYANTDSEARVDYYQMGSLPSTRFDGTHANSGGNHDHSILPTLLPLWQAALPVDAPLSIDVTGSMSGNDGSMQITLTRDTSVDMDTMTPLLHVAFVESHIPEVWMGLEELNFVCRRMIPDHAGTPVDFSGGDVQTVDLDFILDAAWDQSYGSFVIFVQNNTTMQVYQGALCDMNFVQPGRGDLTGTVSGLDTGAALANASLSAGLYQTTADDDGVYLFPNLLDHTYDVTASATGYLPQTHDVAIQPGDAVTEDFVLNPDPRVPHHYILDDFPAGAYGSSLDDLGWTMVDVMEDHPICRLQFDFDWTSDANWWEADFYVTSPEGTQILLFDPTASGTQTGITVIVDSLDGENPTGTWLFNITDTEATGGHSVENATFTVYTLPVPQNLSAVNEGNPEVILSWDAIVPLPEAWNVYRDDVLLDTVENPDATGYADTTVSDGETYTYRLAAVFTQLGESALSDPAEVTVVVDADPAGAPAPVTILHSPSPNPFNPQTRLSFEQARASRVQLHVFNVLGQRVTTLINRTLEQGNHQVVWDGATDSGTPVGSGVYLFRLQSGDEVHTVRGILMK